MKRKPANNPVATASEFPTTSVPASLEQIRAQHLADRDEAADTIHRLEAWRDEIDATIAFLRARK
jgi:hypothetical protein